jgi:hypothetical protein
MIMTFCPRTTLVPTETQRVFPLQVTPGIPPIVLPLGIQAALAGGSMATVAVNTMNKGKANLKVSFNMGVSIDNVFC